MKINFSIKQFFPQKWQVKLPVMLFAVVMMGITLSVLIEIGWGTDPATFMNYHVAALLGTDNIGLIQIMDYAVFLVFVILFGAQHIGFGSIANMFFIGFVSDFSRWIWKLIGFHQFLQNAELLPKAGIFAFILLLFVTACAIYMNSELGIAPYDAVPKIISDRFVKLPFLLSALFLIILQLQLDLWRLALQKTTFRIQLRLLPESDLEQIFSVQSVWDFF